MSEKNIDIIIRGKDQSGPATSALNKLTASTRSFASFAATALGGFSIGVMVSKAVSEFMQAEDAATKLGATLMATGGAAKLSADAMMEFAKAREKITVFDADETIGAEAILATFTKIKGTTFTSAIASAQDLASTFNIDLVDATTKLGKALNDPAQGMSSLSKMGITFTDSQKASVKAMVDTNKVAEAQAFILGVVESRIGGVSKAMAQTSGGQFKQMNNELGNLAETFGGVLIPTLVQGSNSIKHLIQELQKSNGGGKKDDLGDRLAGVLSSPWTSMKFGVDATIASMAKTIGATGVKKWAEGRMQTFAEQIFPPGDIANGMGAWWENSKAQRRKTEANAAARQAGEDSERQTVVGAWLKNNLQGGKGGRGAGDKNNLMGDLLPLLLFGPKPESDINKLLRRGVMEPAQNIFGVFGRAFDQAIGGKGEAKSLGNRESSVDAIQSGSVRYGFRGSEKDTIVQAVKEQKEAVAEQVKQGNRLLQKLVDRGVGIGIQPINK